MPEHIIQIQLNVGPTQLRLALDPQLRNPKLVYISSTGQKYFRRVSVEKLNLYI